MHTYTAKRLRAFEHIHQALLILDPGDPAWLGLVSVWSDLKYRLQVDGVSYPDDTCGPFELRKGDSHA